MLVLLNDLVKSNFKKSIDSNNKIGLLSLQADSFIS